MTRGPRLLCFLFALFAIHWFSTASAQPGKSVELRGVTFETLRVGEWRPDPLAQAVYAETPYARAAFADSLAWGEARSQGRVVDTVELIYTAYPPDTADWITPYDKLMKARLDALFGMAPELRRRQNEIVWRLLAQTHCQTEACARRAFHGFAIKYRIETLTAMQAALLSHDEEQMQLVQDFNLQVVRDLLKGDIPIEDSVLYKAMQRRSAAPGLTAVVDWTASMYPYGAQVVHWARQREGRLAHLLLLNDGDDFVRERKEKPVGATGGFYAAPPDSLTAVIAAMERAMQRGDGGEDDENYVEAILHARERWGGADTLLLVVDNNNGIRDLALVKQVKRPVRVLLCQQGDQPIHPDYLTLVSHAGGYISTLDRDIDLDELRRAMQGGKLTIGAFVYELDASGNYVLVGTK